MDKPKKKSRKGSETAGIVVSFRLAPDLYEKLESLAETYRDEVGHQKREAVGSVARRIVLKHLDKK